MDPYKNKGEEKRHIPTKATLRKILSIKWPHVDEELILKTTQTGQTQYVYEDYP